MQDGNHRLGSSNCDAFRAYTPCQIYVISYHFALAAPLLHLLLKYCFDFCALATVRGLCVVCACSAPMPNRVGIGF
ncbi:hypothetical protein Cenrod_2357 [Candidatus Symbiobacter mobilis CR]|uniref:Uncharacterized protein n=1 Tax=Candidatus Symbiobacter mobilis CR TaxID=946483 RepID=U5NA52_9BURK|nr:hypothetical protein Cenrod_2357 [Candidatus Symbiobacter mobilis CR]